MDKNLSWTSSLGDAYYNHPQEVMDAVQAMRKRAQSAGTLKTTQQQTVTTQEQTIIIEPTNPQVVYLPTTILGWCTGAPLACTRAISTVSSLARLFVFGVGFPIGPFTATFLGVGASWGCDWGNRFIVFNHNSVHLP